MVLITGGAFQGKLEYALELTKISRDEILDGQDCTMEELMRKPMINHFHLWIKRMLDEEHIYEVIEQIVKENPNLIILVDEVGCGIVPMEEKERNYRELVGRVCCVLAKQAKQVHLVTCGIGTVIKDA
jgi:adenosylcobinamide kinase/adenosylcobinamide-phosphate guanylyltransferase